MASSLNVCKVAAAQFVEEREEDVRHHHNNWRQKRYLPGSVCCLLKPCKSSRTTPLSTGELSRATNGRLHIALKRVCRYCFCMPTEIQQLADAHR